MPGPAKRGRKPGAGKLRANGLNRSTASCVKAIDDAKGWTEAADVTCEMLAIPDLETRGGLKKVHRDFTNIYNRLDNLLTQHNDNDRVAGTVVSIFTKMCSDSILRAKLVREKDLLSKLIPLLDRDSCRILVLQALCAITHHGGREIRLEIAKKTPTLVRLLEEFPEDDFCAELVIVIVGHSSSTVVGNEDPPDMELLKAVNVPRLLPLLIFQLKRPNVSSLLVDHAVEFFAAATQHCSKHFFALPSSVNFLIACTRCADIQTRSVAVSSLLRLHLTIMEKEEYTMDPRIMAVNMKRGVPQRLKNAIMSTCGPEESEMFRTYNASGAFMTAMNKYVGDRDMYKFALEVGRLILQTEHSVAQGYFMDDVGLPFTMWVDALPLCAKELRGRGTPDMVDMADIIDLKFLVLQNRTNEAQPMVDRSIQRNPRVPFFYYVKTLGSDSAEGLRAAKKGAKCPNLTAYIKYAMMFRGIEHATSMGLRRLDEACSGGQRWSEGVAFLMCALEDANEFMKSASPDNRGMKTVLCLQPLLSLIIKGNEFGPELKELKEASEKLKLAEEFCTFMGINIKKTDVRMTRDAILARMAAASREWDEAISLYKYEGGRKDLKSFAPEKAEDDLAAWLENVNIDGEGGTASQGILTLEREHMTHPKINPNDVELYRCSWCRNPSAALRKCSICETTRYCDANCQKEHWSTHKKACKRRTT